MKKNTELMANGQAVRMMKINGADFICLTDIARFKNPEFPADVVRNWMRSKMTVAFLGLWEQLHNHSFNMVEFDQFRNEAGTNSFVLPPQVWIERTGAIGIMSKSGRYGGGTFAHHDIAFEFASWVSVEFKLYLITDYQRLKAKEQELIGWSAKRELAKINYRIHTDAIQQNLIPAVVTRSQMNIIYASEADVLNVALFGMTHQQWQAANPTLKGNQRDYATINQLICISNMENINAVMINENAPQKSEAFRREAAQRARRVSARAQRSGRKELRIPQPQRLKKLNEIAIQQMCILSEVEGRKYLK